MNIPTFFKTMTFCPSDDNWFTFWGIWATLSGKHVDSKKYFGPNNNFGLGISEHVYFYPGRNTLTGKINTFPGPAKDQQFPEINWALYRAGVWRRGKWLIPSGGISVHFYPGWNKHVNFHLQKHSDFWLHRFELRRDFWWNELYFRTPCNQEDMSEHDPTTHEQNPSKFLGSAPLGARGVGNAWAGACGASPVKRPRSC